jgi:spermidine synthase
VQIYSAILLGGVAALTWEVLWLHFTSLAIGVSAQAAAITLSAMMMGMAAGSVIAGFLLARLPGGKPQWYLATCETVIGLSGLVVAAGFGIIEHLDVWVFHRMPPLTPIVQALGIAAVIALPAFFMGATMPVFAQISRAYSMSISSLYAVNIAGAAGGILLATFLFIPFLGIKITIGLTASLNMLAALLAFTVRPGSMRKAVLDLAPRDAAPEGTLPLWKSTLVVFTTGLATFALEVAWFRSLLSALQVTTESFALVLFATLIALAVGSFTALALYRGERVPLFFLIALAGFLVLAATPIIERFDLIIPLGGSSYGMLMAKSFLLVFFVLGLPMVALGTGLPWVLEMHRSERTVSILYAVNTVGAVMGSIGAAWIFLPSIGFARTAWLAGILLIFTATVVAGRKRWPVLASVAAAGIAAAYFGESEVGRVRAQTSSSQGGKSHSLVAAREGPDATVSVIEDDGGVRHLVINGFHASGEGTGTHYMTWMGRLPMILHHRPLDALVICFGTGQTANAVRREDPRRLDIVDVSPAVFDLAPFFPKNEKVLQDSRTRKIVMDGRAWLRRTEHRYDVVTLEPMPPTFAGTNSLYSLEFYQLMRKRMKKEGVAAQWLPFYLVDPGEAASIVATFMEVFNDVVLWVDPAEGSTFLVGFKRESTTGKPLVWHGLRRGTYSRDLSDEAIMQSTVFDAAALAPFAKAGTVITDDNQLLSYGYGRKKWWGWRSPQERQEYGLELIRRLAAPSPP